MLHSAFSLPGELAEVTSPPHQYLRQASSGGPGPRPGEGGIAFRGWCITALEVLVLET